MLIKQLLRKLQKKNIMIWVEKDNLCYKGPEQALSPELLTLLRNQKKELIASLQLESGYSKSSIPTPRPVSSHTEGFPLSYAQEPLWFIEELGSDNVSNNLGKAYRLKGPLNRPVLEKAVNGIIGRHEILRTTFLSKKGLPLQVLRTNFEIGILELKLPKNNGHENEGAIGQIINQEVAKTFDLNTGPLIRATLIQLGKFENILILAMHHIITDGFSFGIFFKELHTLYKAFSNGNPSPLPDLPIQYSDYVTWERNRFQGEFLVKQLDYWKENLKGNLPTLELPIDKPRPKIQTYHGARCFLSIPSGKYGALKALSQKEGCTLFMTLIAILQTLLHRYTGQDDIIIGSPIVTNRDCDETQKLIGLFLNMLVLRTDLGGNPKFVELMHRTREVALGAYANQHVPFEKLVEKLQPERDPSRNALFQVALQLSKDDSLELPGLSVTPMDVDGMGAQFDLSLDLWESPEGLHGFLEYNTDLFEPATINRMRKHLQTLIEGLVTNPEEKIADLPILTEREKYQLLVDWNDTKTNYPGNLCVHQLFEKQAARIPNSTAVVFENGELTYQELNERSNQLAHYLQKLEIQADTLVGLCVERSIELIVGVLGILKAGGAYVPLDPGYPQERLAFILEDTQLRVVLTQKKLVKKFSQCCDHAICLDRDWNRISIENKENPKRNVTPENLAYVIYTSGSTGKPKGVMIEHSAIFNYTVFAGDTFALSSSDRLLQFASICFDTAAEEIFCCITCGATLVLRTKEMLNSVPEFLHQCKNLDITVLDIPTAYWHEIIREFENGTAKLPESIRLVVIGGEKAIQTRLDQWLDHLGNTVRLINTYGPTEATIVSTIKELSSIDKNRRVPQIGNPISNTQIYILDKYQRPVPIGIPGEMHIGGDGLARGYLNRPELTKEKFIPDLFSKKSGARLYRSGDLARYSADGNIEYLERIDFQVKIRGFRIEFGEIEATLAQHPQISEAIVITKEKNEGDKSLIAYIVFSDKQKPAPHIFKKFLKQKLPEYMIPSAFVSLRAIPLTRNGKIDLKSLPSPELEDISSNVFVPPRSHVEVNLAKIWKDLFGIKKVGIHNNFFELGGHSLLATQAISRLPEIFNVELPLVSLFENPTIAELGQRIETILWLNQNSNSKLEPNQEIRQEGKV